MGGAAIDLAGSRYRKGLSSRKWNIHPRHYPLCRRPMNPALLASWASGDPCADHWAGVSCNNGVVVGLQLSNSGLQGTLPPELGNLTSLNDIQLYNNRLSGTLPPELFRLISLTGNLGLFNNAISGTLSSQIGALSNVNNVGLTGNQLIGTLPTSLGLLSAVRHLQLGSNRFIGSISAELSALALDYLNLDGNSLSGPIPAFLGAITTLQTGLMLGNNRFSGPLPLTLSALSSLQSFDVYNNPCVYGPRVSIGSVGTSYDISGTAIGTWSVPVSCNLTLAPAPPPAPPSPPSPPAPPPPHAASSNDRAAMMALNASWCVHLEGRVQFVSMVCLMHGPPSIHLPLPS